MSTTPNLLDQVDAENQQAVNPQAQSPTPASQPISVTSSGNLLDQVAAEDEQQQQARTQPTKPTLSPEEQASQTRQMAVSGLTGMPTPNMTVADKTAFERGKATGAISVPAVAAGTVGLTAIPEVLPSVLPHTIEGVKAIGAWAEAHPVQAYILFQVVKELIPGAKKTMGFIKAAPTGE